MSYSTPPCAQKHFQILKHVIKLKIYVYLDESNVTYLRKQLKEKNIYSAKKFIKKILNTSRSMIGS